MLHMTHFANNGAHMALHHASITITFDSTDPRSLADLDKMLEGRIALDGVSVMTAADLTLGNWLQGRVTIATLASGGFVNIQRFLKAYEALDAKDKSEYVSENDVVAHCSE